MNSQKDYRTFFSSAPAWTSYEGGGVDLAAHSDTYVGDEETRLVTRSLPSYLPSWRPQDRGFGLLPWMNYRIHVPFDLSKATAGTEGSVVFWDDFASHHKEPGSTPEDKTEPTPSAIIPPLLHRIGALILLFVLIFGPALGYASIGKGLFSLIWHSLT